MFDHMYAADLAKIGAGRVGKYHVPFVDVVLLSVLGNKISLTGEIWGYVSVNVPCRIAFRSAWLYVT